MRTKITTRLRNNFIAGLMVVIPLGVTVWIVSIIVRWLDRLIKVLLPSRLEKIFQQEQPYLWKGIAILAILILMMLIGMFARNIVGRKLIGLWEKLLNRIPLVNRIYGALQQMSQAFLGERRTGFSRVVLFQYPRVGLYILGLVSGEGGEEIKEKTGEKMLSVFVPTTPNPTSGLLILVPEKDTIPLKMTVEEGLKLLISGGTVIPSYHRKSRCVLNKMGQYDDGI
ncbi:DUF502 domain-containing protein [candidate division NPL-UPA2 bacterium]|nr:DUF502 domain-containing protein [candidate division NPL-UPA2 bacterium]